jgi:hypothetical protein
LAVQNSIIHGSTTSLLADDHTQYLLLAGRSGGQTINQNVTFTNNIILSNPSSAFTYSVAENSSGYLEISPSTSTGTQRVVVNNMDRTSFFKGATEVTYLDYSGSQQNFVHNGLLANYGNINIFGGDLFVQNLTGTTALLFSEVLQTFSLTRIKASDTDQVAIDFEHYNQIAGVDTDLLTGDLIGAVNFKGLIVGVGMTPFVSLQANVRVTPDSGELILNILDAGTDYEVMRWGAPAGNPRFAVNTTSLTAAMLFLNQNNVTNALPVIRMQQSDLSEEYFDFRTTVATGNPVNTTALGTYYGRVRVAVNGTIRWLALYNT